MLVLQFCECSPGYMLVAGPQKSCMPIASSFDQHRTLFITSITAASGVVALAAIVVSLLWLLRVQIAAFTLQRAKMRGPPGDLTTAKALCSITSEL